VARHRKDTFQSPTGLINTLTMNRHLGDESSHVVTLARLINPFGVTISSLKSAGCAVKAGQPARDRPLL
jgi:hypothetical protein